MKRYAVRPSIPTESEGPLLAFPYLTRHLLFHRGISTSEEAQAFLNPDFDAHTHDPFLLKDMQKVVERVTKAIKENEKTVIFSDYDADGIPGGVVLHDFFHKVGFGNFENYIPHRHDEGFGLNVEAVEEFAKNGVKLLITIDCGIADLAEAARAKELGIDLIITDHHLPLTEIEEFSKKEVQKLPEAFAIINPKQSDCAYPEKMLCGSGVIFKFVQGMVKSAPEEWGLKPGWEKWLLDMVGMATLSDMVPLTGENRAFAFYGLKVLRKSPRVGLMKLLSKLKTNQRLLVEDDIGFTISPRINAASRMGVPRDAFLLLSTTDEVEADRMSDHLNKINDERKGIVASMVKEIRHALKAREIVNPKLIVLGNPNWKPSLLGLAANTLMEEYGCPVFLWGRDGEDVLKGSCRSDGSVSLQKLMAGVSAGILSAHGGHELAGGFAVTHEHVHRLEEELLRVYEAHVVAIASDDSKVENEWVDAQITFDEVSWQTYGQLEKLAPFGTGNPKPLFLFKDVPVSEVKCFGKEKNHLELGFKKSDGKKVSAIGFFSKPEDWKLQTGKELKAGEKISLVASMEKSTFRNFPELRLRIVDIV